MKRGICLFLAFTMMISMSITSFAANEVEEYYTVPVEYSDSIGQTEHLKVMIRNSNVYVDARMLAERLGYAFGENDDSVVIYNKDTSNGLPFGITQFKYNSTQVSHMLFNNYIDTYEAPFASVKNSDGSWIPLEYTLLIINSGMMITDNALLIDMPTKRITDYLYEIMKNSVKYQFDWADDFGYTETDIKVLGGSSHLINVFNGLLRFDGASWATLFQQFAGSMAAYDKKYGENLALLLCTESDKELQASIDRVELLNDLLNADGDLGKLLSFTSEMTDFQVGTLYQQCEAAMNGIKAGNSAVASYNRSYQALEKALDKQTWFSNTGGNILEVQKGVTSSTGKAFKILEVATKVAEVVGYAQEFQSQDEFSSAALTYYLSTANGGLELPVAMKKSMIEYSDALSSSIGEYTAKRFAENVDQWIIDEIPMHEVLGTQAAAVLFAWNIASNTIPFIANGLSGADSFELALYSMSFQGDTFLNYLDKRDSIFSNAENITAENLYALSQYCYIYLKSCYTTREAALASLANKSNSTKEKIQPLIDYQNKINSEIATILVELKGTNESNEHCEFGFLPVNNDEYLGEYDDSQLIVWVKKPRSNIEKIELVSNTYFDEAQETAFEYAIITAYNDVGEVVWKYETPKCIMTEMDAIVELGQRGNRYYFVEDTSVVCIDVESGAVLWKNNDYAGRATGIAFGENAIYLCGQYGPDFYAVSYEGKTLARIQEFNPQYCWASKIELLVGTAAVYLYGGTDDYDKPMVYYVDLGTFSYSKSYHTDSYAESYKSTLSQYPEYEEKSWGKEYTEYTLYDVNKDGIPELIIKKPDIWNYVFYTYNGTESVLCGELWDSCFGTYAELYEYEGNGIVVHGGGMGSDRIEHMYVQQLVNNSLTEGEFSASTEEISFDELYSMLEGYTPIDNFYRLTDLSVLDG